MRGSNPRGFVAIEGSGGGDESGGEGGLAAGEGGGAKAGSTRLTGMAGRVVGDENGRGRGMSGELLTGVGGGVDDATRLGEALGGMAGMLVVGRGLATQARPPPFPPPFPTSLPPPIRLRSPSDKRLALTAAAPDRDVLGNPVSAAAVPAARIAGTTATTDTAAALIAKLLLTIPPTGRTLAKGLNPAPTSPVRVSDGGLTRGKHSRPHSSG